MGGFSYSQVSCPILPGPASRLDFVPSRLWSNGMGGNVFAGTLKHFNGLEKKTILRDEKIHHTFDPVASGFDPALDTVVDPTQIDPAITTGEMT